MGVEPGMYEIRMEMHKASLLAKTEIADGARVVLEPRQFGPAAVEATRRRGDVDDVDLSVGGRNRISIRWGKLRTTEPFSGSKAFDGFGGIEYTRYIREDFAISVGVTGPVWVRGTDLPFSVLLPPGFPSPERTFFFGQGTLVSMPIIVRWNPLTRGREHRAIKPFLAAGASPVLGWGRESHFTGSTVTVEKYRKAAATLHLGAGVDFHLTRRFAFGFNAGYNSMVRPFARPIGSTRDHSVPELSVNVGWTFGRGRTR